MSDDTSEPEDTEAIRADEERSRLLLTVNATALINQLRKLDPVAATNLGLLTVIAQDLRAVRELLEAQDRAKFLEG